MVGLKDENNNISYWSLVLDLPFMPFKITIQTLSIDDDIDNEHLGRNVNCVMFMQFSICNECNYSFESIQYRRCYANILQLFFITYKSQKSTSEPHIPVPITSIQFMHVLLLNSVSFGFVPFYQLNGSKTDKCLIIVYHVCRSQQSYTLQFPCDQKMCISSISRGEAYGSMHTQYSN